MQKRVAIISGLAKWGHYIHQLLDELFQGSLLVEEYNSDENVISKPIDVDMIIVTQPIVYYAAKKFIDSSIPMIELTTTITNRQYKMLQEIPAGTKVLVVNDDNGATIETIYKLQDLGLTHLEYEPYSDQMVVESKPLIAITPGETELVPKYIETVIDIGPRVIDAHCLTQIAVQLDMDYILSSSTFEKYFAKIRHMRTSLMYLHSRSSAMSDLLLTMMNILDEGILVTDAGGRIQNCNENAKKILGLSKITYGNLIFDILPCPQAKKISEIRADTDFQLVNIGNRILSIRIIPSVVNETYYGAVLVVNNFSEKEKKQGNLRRQMLNKGHIAKNTFANIITEDVEMLQLKNLAKKQAATDATILITGESGTGKEVLAQAIHNASPRRKGPFVALNCTTLPGNLLESELFGYEEGTFTGARKGGKPGMFELAHTGTIFLDEIGDMALNLQIKLLRVLEEREVMHIGGNSVISIDIRVIAATNQDLWGLMEQGKFRQDLFYRLNVIPVTLKPLRQRPADIPLLFDYFLKKMGQSLKLTPEARQVIADYPWYGNIRELRNCVEYLSFLEKPEITERDLQHFLHFPAAKRREGRQSGKGPLPQSAAETAVPCATAETALPAFMGEAGIERICFLILETLAKSCGQGLGRQKLLQRIRNAGYWASDAELRKALVVLHRDGLVVTGGGRAGSKLTLAGQEAFSRLWHNADTRAFLSGLQEPY